VVETAAVEAERLGKILHGSGVEAALPEELGGDTVELHFARSGRRHGTR
jgi:hypothetical protein